MFRDCLNNKNPKLCDRMARVYAKGIGAVDQDLNRALWAARVSCREHKDPAARVRACRMVRELRKAGKALKRKKAQ
jgi:hypothetical protein